MWKLSIVLDISNSISEYYETYNANKARDVRKSITLPNDEREYINEKDISCSMRTLYRIFKRSKDLDVTSLPMKGKRHPNGHVERRGKAGRLGRAITERYKDYP